MTRGRKPIPTELHRLKGTLNVTKHLRDRAGEPVAEGDVGGPPDWMSEAQQAIWREAVDNAPHGVLKACDAGLLAVWVVAADQHRTATIQQAKLDAGNSLPLLSKDRAGTAAASLYLAIQNRAATIMIKAGSELGFSPSTRPRMVGSPAKPERSVWDELDKPLQVLPGGRTN